MVAVAVGTTLYLTPRKWSISEQRKNNLKAALNASPLKFPVLIIVVPGALNDALDVAYKFKDIIGGIRRDAIAIRAFLSLA